MSPWDNLSNIAFDKSISLWMIGHKFAERFCTLLFNGILEFRTKGSAL
jgi:hypothetical protein